MTFQPLAINTYGTAVQPPSGRMSLVGQHKPEALIRMSDRAHKAWADADAATDLFLEAGTVAARENMNAKYTAWVKLENEYQDALKAWNADPAQWEMDQDALDVEQMYADLRHGG